MLRHRRNCIPQKVRTALKAQNLLRKRKAAAEIEKFEQNEALQLADAMELQLRVEALYGKALAGLDAAEKAGDLKLIPSFIREARESILLAAKFQGLLGDGAKTTIDARRQTIQIVGNLSDSDLDALIAAGRHALSSSEPAEILPAIEH